MTLPSKDQFSSQMKEMDIRKSDTIVCYDDMGLVAAARASWMLRAFGAKNVHILNQTYSNWIEEGRPIDESFSDPFIRNGPRSAPLPGDFEYRK